MEGWEDGWVNGWVDGWVNGLDIEWVQWIQQVKWVQRVEEAWFCFKLNPPVV